ncbi:hypothetical protein BG58_10905 [Caballeronia jiangsuensis]|nr:hypothetical protein BG58_10905 [Caballeronia jiangsuensis]
MEAKWRQVEDEGIYYFQYGYCSEAEAIGMHGKVSAFLAENDLSDSVAVHTIRTKTESRDSATGKYGVHRDYLYGLHVLHMEAADAVHFKLAFC